MLIKHISIASSERSCQLLCGNVDLLCPKKGSLLKWLLWVALLINIWLKSRRLFEMVVFTLTLVRHGETGANKENVIQGQLDVPLSEAGLKQAHLLGLRLQNQSYTHVFSSDLLRAKQTVQMVVDKNQHTKCAVVHDVKLRERKFGELEGKTFNELKKLARRANQSVSNFTPVGAETIQQVHHRARLFFQELCQQLLNSGSCAGTSADMLEQSSVSGTGIKRRRHSSLCSDEFVSADAKTSTDVPSSVRDVSKCKKDRIDDLCHLTVKCPDMCNSYGQHPVPSDKIIKIAESSNEKLFTRNTANNPLCVYVPSRCTRSRHKSSENGASLATINKTIIDTSSVHPVDSPSPNRCNCQCTNILDGDCPNVSLLPLIEHRLSRISSADSDRKASIDSSNDDYDSPQCLIANVLVVSHGGILREMIRHFVENLGCSLPGGKGQALRLSPNTGLSKFTVSLTDVNENPKIICLLIHDKDHLTENGVYSVNSSVL